MYQNKINVYIITKEGLPLKVKKEYNELNNKLEYTLQEDGYKIYSDYIKNENISQDIYLSINKINLKKSDSNNVIAIINQNIYIAYDVKDDFIPTLSDIQKMELQSHLHGKYLAKNEGSFH